jgi:hypothetical protein
MPFNFHSSQLISQITSILLVSSISTMLLVQPASASRDRFGKEVLKFLASEMTQGAVSGFFSGGGHPTPQERSVAPNQTILIPKRPTPLGSR